MRVLEYEWFKQIPSPTPSFEHRLIYRKSRPNPLRFGLPVGIVKVGFVVEVCDGCDAVPKPEPDERFRGFGLPQMGSPEPPKGMEATLGNPQLLQDGV